MLVDVPGGRLSYTVFGHGQPCCLTHQYSAATGGGPLQDILARRLACHAFDPRGVGESSAPRGPDDLTMSALVDDLEVARRALGLGPWVVAGASTGGMVALLYALRHPEAVAALVLLGAAASWRYIAGSIYDPSHPRAAEMQRAWQALQRGGPDGARAWHETVMRLSVAHPERLPPAAPPAPKGFSSKRLEAFTRELYRFDLEAELHRVTAPTLVMVGALDPQCPPANSRRIAAGIPGARLVVVPDCGHRLATEEPERVAAEIGDFLAAEAQAGSR